MTSLAHDPNARNKIPTCALILTLIIVLGPFLSIANESDESIDSLLTESVDEQSRHYSRISNYSVNNFEVGGYHKVTNVWWEPTNPYVPTVDDPDGDGVNSSEDEAPWNPNLPVTNALDCTTEICERRDVFSLSRTGEFAPFTEEMTWYSSITDAALGDLDNDGDLDMVFIHKDAVEVSENVDGTFQKPGECISGQVCRWVSTDYTKQSHLDIGSGKKVELVDFNGDGSLDIVAAGSYAIGIISMDGLDMTGWGEVVSQGVNGRANWESFDIGDVNADGRPDIAVASLWPTNSASTYRLTLILNECTQSTWAWDISWSGMSGNSHGIELTDINNDGYDDLVVSTLDADNISRYEIVVYPSDGTTLDTFPSTEWSFSMEGWAVSILSSNASVIRGLDSADLNGDGFMDLIVSSSYLGFALFNDGSGTIDSFPDDLYADSHLEIFCNVWVSPCAMALPHRATVDINNDGLLDILYGQSIYLNSGSNNDGESNQFEPFWGAEASVFKVGDLTGNGVLDVIGVTEEGGPVVIFTQGGSILSNDFGNAQMPTGMGLEPMTDKGVVSDYDFDGDLDIISTTDHYILLYVNDGMGSFSSTSLYSSNVIRSLDIGDIDGDGLSDLVVASTNRIGVYWGISISSQFASFETNATWIVNYDSSPNYAGWSTYYDSIVVEDFNGDGMDEISYDIYWSNVFYYQAGIIEYNNSRLNYTQSPRSNYSFEYGWVSHDTSTDTLRHTKLMDMNNDGNDDFVRCRDESIEIYNNSGDYFSELSWNLSVDGENCMLFDATLDGIPDLLSINGSTIEVRMGPDYTHMVMSKVVYAITAFEIYDMDQDGWFELLIATSENKRMRIHDLDYTGIIGQIWEGGSYSYTVSVTIGDFNNDGRPDVLQQNYGSAWDLILGIQDTDYDSLGDSDDEFPTDPTQIADSDGDGYGDSKIGRMGDNCTYYWGDSQYDQRGCPDQDGDGWSDLGDDFWREPTQWIDSDGDGFGDNYDAGSSRLAHWPGEMVSNAYNPDPSPLDFDNDGFEDEGLSPFGVDDCPKDQGWSFEDRFGCLDTDWDGWSNNDDLWDQGDAFSNDFSQHNDTDGDGFGDNLNGTNGDEFPNDQCAAHDMDHDGMPDFIKPNCETTLVKDDDTDGDGFNNSMENLLGTNPNNAESKPLDYDGDGAADIVDAFPEDPSERQDTDKDGIGDNADFCIQKGTNGSFVDCTRDRDNDGFNDSIDQFPTDDNEWIDSDGDGVGDNSDVWPTDSDIWSDSDGDGWADQFGHLLTDDCPSIPGTSSRFMMGCSDLDEDGMPDILDPDIDGDGITNDNEMDASSGNLQFDIFDADSYPADIDGDSIPDVLDEDRDGDGFPDDMEKQRGSDYKDANKTPFNIYGNQDTGLFYVPGEGFKSQYDPEGMEISVSVVIDLITSELLLPISMIPLSILLSTRKRRRYNKLKRKIDDCKDIDILKEYEQDIDNAIINKKVKVEHGMLLRNMFERVRDEFEDKEQVRLLGGKPQGDSGGMGGGPSSPGARGMGGGTSLPGSRGPSPPQRGRY